MKKLLVLLFLLITTLSFAKYNKIIDLQNKEGKLFVFQSQKYYLVKFYLDWKVQPEKVSLHVWDKYGERDRTGCFVKFDMEYNEKEKYWYRYFPNSKKYRNLYLYVFTGTLESPLTVAKKLRKDELFIGIADFLYVFINLQEI